jgi:predicted Co/Zn/Cd cation transporter (cation efflux family)
MRAEDIFWFNEHHIEKIGEVGRKKLIKLIEALDKESKPKPVSKKDQEKEEMKRQIMQSFERAKKRNREKK